MERSGNFYKAIRLGYILISILIGCMDKEIAASCNFLYLLLRLMTKQEV